MKITLTGSSARYTVEQLCEMLLPDCDGVCDCRVTGSGDRLYALCRVSGPKGTTQGVGRCRKTGDEYRDVNLERRALARAAYRAILPQLDRVPEWGMLSGVRPAKLVRAHLSKGGTLSGAEHFLRREYFVSPEKAALCGAAGAVAYQTEKSLSLGSYALYAHIPFCPSRCDYCSFISAAGDAFSRWGGQYFDALCRELTMLGEVRETAGLHADSIYIGGGTPAVYSADRLYDLCRAALLSCHRIPEEFTVEAGRPDAITEEKLAALKEGSVTRICINPQTMHDETLRRIGRAHTAQDVRRAFSMARDAGFEAINCDLIAGLPEESPEDFAASLREVLALGPENITVHTLARKRGSSFNERRGESMPAPILRRALEQAAEMLSGAGYEPYYLYRQKYTGGGFENIGWTKPGFVCRYNVVMMEEIGDILSAGAGAVTKLTSRDFVRITNPKYPQEYLSSFNANQKKTAITGYYAKAAFPEKRG